jgi:hypothetical protein
VNRQTVRRGGANGNRQSANVKRETAIGNRQSAIGQTVNLPRLYLLLAFNMQRAACSVQLYLFSACSLQLYFGLKLAAVFAFWL